MKISYDLFGRYMSPRRARSHLRTYEGGNLEVTIIFANGFELSGYPHGEEDIEMLKKLKNAYKLLTDNK